MEKRTFSVANQRPFNVDNKQILFLNFFVFPLVCQLPVYLHSLKTPEFRSVWLFTKCHFYVSWYCDVLGVHATNKTGSSSDDWIY
jgi:hypothetical protein